MDTIILKRQFIETPIVKFLKVILGASLFAVHDEQTARKRQQKMGHA